MIVIVATLIIWISKALQDASMASGVGFNSDAKYKSPREPVSNIYFYPYWLYHKLNGLKHVERFPFSATFLVMFTDFWHLAGFFRNAASVTILWYYTGWNWFAIYFIALIVFKVVYITFRKFS